MFQCSLSCHTAFNKTKLGSSATGQDPEGHFTPRSEAWPYSAQQKTLALQTSLMPRGERNPSVPQSCISGNGLISELLHLLQQMTLQRGFNRTGFTVDSRISDMKYKTVCSLEQSPP